ncbi:hypothetical protein GLOIN_2v1480211 [Rhizophagus irregularis DAOM 181602=DAOM 197198]|nr:hypothetical protein GLOIN_2v1480211 [Rhizophagus irregularis DAOM 181602=DAOM 197198]
MEQTPETELRPIYKPTSKYNLQDALGLKNEKQRWLAYLEIMREFRSFKKKAPDFPITAADWAVKEMLVSTIQNKRYYLKKKKNELENNLRVPPQNSPALQDKSNKLQERKNKSFSNNKRKRDKVNSLNETIENKDKEITQLKRQKTFAVELYQQKLNQ